MRTRILIYFLLTLCILGVGIFLFIRPYDLFLKNTSDISFRQLIFEKGSFKNTAGKVNILLLGKAGGDHEGADLTDSIIGVSIDTTLNTIYTISVSRDIWSDALQDKINTAYYYGKIKGRGFDFAKKEIELVTGIRFDYVALIDFERFKELIDYVDGIDVSVENAFDDLKYPIEGRKDDICDGDPEYKCRYEHISFKKGWMHMNGEVALKYARSRNAVGDEGTDFARGRRQQKMITALYEKIIERIKKVRFEEVQKIYEFVDALIERDIENKEALYLLKEIVYNGQKLSFHEISFPKELFFVPLYRSYHGKYVLIPREGNYTLMYLFIQCSLAGRKDCKK